MADPKARKSPAPAAPRTRDAVSAPGSTFSPAALLDFRQPYLLPLLLVLFTRWYFTTLIPFAAEDAYITFRYARNFANHLGLVYNPGERVMGFSSPLWTLWCALGFTLHIEPETWTRISSLVLDLGAVFAMVTLLRRHASETAAWAFALFFGSWPYFGAAVASGMESSAFFALIALAALAIEGRSPLAGPAIAAVAFIRPEGVLAAGVLLLGATWRDRIVALVLAALGAGALVATYGSIIPQSVLAKSQVYGHPGPWAGRHWWEWLFPAPLGRWPTIGEGNFLVPLAVILAPALVLGLVELWRRRTSALALALGAAFAVYLAYVVVGATYFWWYFLVPLAAIVGIASVGLPRVLHGRAVAISLVLVLAGMWTLQPDLYRGRAQSEYDSFTAAARILSANAEASQKVMLEPIGIIGYTVGAPTPMRVVDEVGLVSPQVSQRRQQGPGWYTDIEAREHPDWLIVRRGVLMNVANAMGAGQPFRSRAERDTLIAHYAKIAVVDSLAGDNAMFILRRAR